MDNNLLKEFHIKQSEKFLRTIKDHPLFGTLEKEEIVVIFIESTTKALTEMLEERLG